MTLTKTDRENMLEKIDDQYGFDIDQEISLVDNQHEFCVDQEISLVETLGLLCRECAYESECDRSACLLTNSY